MRVVLRVFHEFLMSLRGLCSDILVALATMSVVNKHSDLADLAGVAAVKIKLRIKCRIVESCRGESRAAS